ncbi:28 kDa inner dynein arm light chain, axonemal [Orchesella cincta]|uniref:28 kDa inner dynein arm light chain, axonemal n=1 Tax=Orchesella cincta TaxID=48709 RepID=A0A1D2MNT5_ORCCI|nr:28 kDa inner dynein arm light chain, axonemal [Orchesella cincta]
MALPHAQSVPSIHTFLKYENPTEMLPDEPDPPREKSMEWLKFWLFRTSDMRFIPDPRLVEYVSEYKKCKRKQAPSRKSSRTFLESLFPTKYWTDNGVRFKQRVSTLQSTRPELLNIFKTLESEMVRRQANKINTTVASYCPIRYTLHMELFDELIRQVTIECRFRGYLLNRVRGELYQTLDAFKVLLQTSVVEESRSNSTEVVDPEIISLRSRLATLEGEVSALQMQKFYFGCDYKELCDKMDLLDRIRTHLHEPEIEFTNKIQHAMERQLFHFENPPSMEEEELEQVLIL